MSDADARGERRKIEGVFTSQINGADGSAPDANMFISAAPIAMSANRSGLRDPANMLRPVLAEFPNYRTNVRAGPRRRNPAPTSRCSSSAKIPPP